MNYNKRLFLSFCVLISGALLAAEGTVASPQTMGRIIAKVNNEIITSKDLDDYCLLLSYQNNTEGAQFDCSTDETRSRALDKLIDDTLILAKAKQEKLDIPSSLIESKLSEIISSYPSRDAFEQSLLEKGLTRTLLEEKIKDQYLVRRVIDKYVRATISVSPQEISTFYNKYLDRFSSPQEYILWVAKSENRNSVEKITQYLSEHGLAATQKEYPQMLMKIQSTAEELKTEISTLLKGMHKGSYSMREIDGITYLLYFEDMTPAKTYALDDVKEKIYSFLWQKKFEARFAEWVSDLKKKGVVEVYPRS
jgi:hypothetical protein